MRTALIQLIISILLVFQIHKSFSQELPCKSYYPREKGGRCQERYLEDSNGEKHGKYITFTLFGLLMFHDNVISQERRDITLYVLGVLSAVLTQVFGFYFGSSQGSVDKNSTIRSLNESLAKSK